MAMEPAAISARPAVITTRLESMAPERPAASANGTVRPSAIPITMSRIVADAGKCFSRWGVWGTAPPLAATLMLHSRGSCTSCTAAYMCARVQLRRAAGGTVEYIQVVPFGDRALRKVPCAKADDGGEAAPKQESSAGLPLSTGFRKARALSRALPVQDSRPAPRARQAGSLRLLSVERNRLSRHDDGGRGDRRGGHGRQRRNGRASAVPPHGARLG